MIGQAFRSLKQLAGLRRSNPAHASLESVPYETCASCRHPRAPESLSDTTAAKARFLVRQTIFASHGAYLAWTAAVRRAVVPAIVLARQRSFRCARGREASHPAPACGAEPSYNSEADDALADSYFRRCRQQCQTPRRSNRRFGHDDPDSACSPSHRESAR